MGWFDALLPLVCFLVNVAAHILWVRSGRVGLLAAVQKAFVFGIVLLIGGGMFPIFMEGGRGWSSTFSMTQLISYVALSYGYFHVVNLGETARRMRILWELYEVPGGLTEADLLHRYNSREIVSRRLNRLLSNGQISLEGDRYHLSRSSVWAVSRAILAMKRVFLGKNKDRYL